MPGSPTLIWSTSRFIPTGRACFSPPAPRCRRPAGGGRKAPGAGFYRSADGGESWARLTGGLPDRIGPAPRSIAVDPASPDTVFIGLNDGALWASRDGGQEFSCIASGLPPILGIAPVPA